MASTDEFALDGRRIGDDLAADLEARAGLVDRRLRDVVGSPACVPQ
jgi:hypothetical protein